MFNKVFSLKSFAQFQARALLSQVLRSVLRFSPPKQQLTTVNFQTHVFRERRKNIRSEVLKGKQSLLNQQSTRRLR